MRSRIDTPLKSKQILIMAYLMFASTIVIDMLHTTILVSVFLVIQIIPSLASVGDYSLDFRYCLSECLQKSCSELSLRHVTLPWYLRIFLWTCSDECRYSCMHEVTTEDVNLGRPIRQFYGKVCL